MASHTGFKHKASSLLSLEEDAGGRYWRQVVFFVPKAWQAQPERLFLTL